MNISSKPPRSSGLLLWMLSVVMLLAMLASLPVAYVYWKVQPALPALDLLNDFQPKIPLRIYTADRVLIREFGDDRRDVVQLAEMPQQLKAALLMAEDRRFYEHGPVDWNALMRAAHANLGSNSKQGASTITMQVAREFFLTREKKYSRKLKEILLAYKIESQFSKDRILEAYMNRIYLGEHAYGFASAAQAYFAKPVEDLTLAECAMLAGLPQAPAARNPFADPQRARQRQEYILHRMRTYGVIDEAQLQQALHEPLNLRRGAIRREPGTHAEYVAEIVRQALQKQYPKDLYTKGYTVTTTLRKADQDAAYEAVRRGLLEYDRRHGYRGPEAFVELPQDESARKLVVETALRARAASEGLLPALVLAATAKQVRAQLPSGESIEIEAEGLRFAAPGLKPQAERQLRITPGALIRVSRDARHHWAIGQLPEAAAAMVALDAQDGAVRAWIGGFDFQLSQFDRVSQAWRQPGSSFKPFVYSAALEKGFFPATLINDAPLIVSREESGGGQVWIPRNDDGVFVGPISMRAALAHSNNVASVRILRAITPGYAQEYVSRFGFDPAKHRANLTMALGSGAVTPLQMAGAYAVFANGGYQVAPYVIQTISDADGKVLFDANPERAGDERTRVLDPRNAFMMDAMLREVVNSGTGAQASRRLGRSDLAGKTGTSSDAVDGWFAGYGGSLVAVSWMGFDDPKSLGTREFGSTLALPAWVHYMRVALHGKPPFKRPVPDGLAHLEGDWVYREFAGGGAVHALGIEIAAPVPADEVPVVYPAANVPQPEQVQQGIFGFFN